MIVFHMSNTLKPGMSFSSDYQNASHLAMPFVQALEQSHDCFAALFLSAKYTWAVLDKFGMNSTFTDYSKWATEGVFEYVRKNEYPECCSRLTGNFFYDDQTNQDDLFDYVWGSCEDPHEKESVKFYAIELDDSHPSKHDMLWFDEAYDLMEDPTAIDKVITIARKYFSGAATEHPLWELLSDKQATVLKERT